MASPQRSRYDLSFVSSGRFPARPLPLSLFEGAPDAHVEQRDPPDHVRGDVFERQPPPVRRDRGAGLLRRVAGQALRQPARDMGLMDVLGDMDVAIDAGPLIYWFENHDTWAPVLEPLFAAAERRERLLAASELALLEVLVGPLSAGDRVLAGRLENALSHGPWLDVLPISRAVLVRAAELRARSRVKTPDALHLATALLSGCGAFVTNDRRIPDIEGLLIVGLRDLV